MPAQIIGLSGSPIKNGNTDRLVQAVLRASGLEHEFIKLSQKKIQPCMACLGCAADNQCKLDDDFLELAPKIRAAGAIVVGAYPPYGSMDAFTKAFLERLFSLRHRNGLNRGKLAVVVVTGIGRDKPGTDEAARQITHALNQEGMEVLGQLKAVGNPVCMNCGFGQNCPMSSLPLVFGEDTTVTPEKFCAVEDQAVWAQAQELGREIARRLDQRQAV